MENAETGTVEQSLLSPPKLSNIVFFLALVFFILTVTIMFATAFSDTVKAFAAAGTFLSLLFFLGSGANLILRRRVSTVETSHYRTSTCAVSFNAADSTHFEPFGELCLDGYAWVLYLAVSAESLLLGQPVRGDTSSISSVEGFLHGFEIPLSKVNRVKVTQNLMTRSRGGSRDGILRADWTDPVTGKPAWARGECSEISLTTTRAQCEKYHLPLE